MEIKKDHLTNPPALGYLSEEAIQSGAFEYADCIYAFGIEGIILASAISMINKNPIITKEVIEMLKVETIPESINLVFITFSVDDFKEINNEIKLIRDKGIKLDTLLSVTEIPENIRKELRILGINCVCLHDNVRNFLKYL